MKRITILTWCCVLGLIQVAAADEIVPNRAMPQRVAPARSNGQSPRVIAAHNQLPLQSAGSIRRNYAALAQPQQRVAPVVNTQGSLRNYPIRRTLNQSRATSANRVAFQNANNNRTSYFDALRRYRRESHDCNWWRQHYRVIVFVSSGFYYLDAGYWYPAWGYDPAYNNYDYDGPIYTYGDLLPDQVVVNVQKALQEEGYYTGPITGSLGPTTRAALADYQRDYGLVITGAIDEPTIESLGLN